MKPNWNFIIILIIIFAFVYFENSNEKFTNSEYKIIIVSNKDYYLIHLSNSKSDDDKNKIYKIYKNKFII